MLPRMHAKLDAQDVTIHYRRRKGGEPFLAVANASMRITAGEFVAIVGPSGCGKTTFLNAADGLVPITGGSLTLDGKRITGPGRDRAVVFQQPSLLPWRSVTGNIKYGMETQGGLSSSEMKERVDHYIELVGLKHFADSYPNELSAGMQQRVNLARALATRPDVLLLDEPFGALDAQTRETMQLELLRIWSESRQTAMFVTHDIVEAVYLADRVLVFSARPGRVKLEVDVPLERPRDLRIKRDPRFLEIENTVWESIREEVLRASADTEAA